jgi:Flp pilus assembly protein TadD
MALFRLEQYAEAVSSYDKALAINPEDPEARECREIALKKQI